MNSVKILKTVLLMLLIGVGIFAFGCSAQQTGQATGEQGKDTKTSAPAAAPEQKQEKVIVIGSPLPLTGGLAPNGKSQRDGMLFWQEKVNASGGIKVNGETYKVELKIYDYASDTNTAVKLTEKLISEDGVKFIFSAFGSAATMAMAPITEKYGVIQIAPTAASEAIFRKGYKYLFGTQVSNRAIALALVEMAVAQTPKPESIAILARNDFFPAAIAKEVKAVSEEKGMKVVYHQEYPVGTQEFATALTDIKRLNPDMVLFTGYTSEHIVAIKQARQIRFSPKLFANIVDIFMPEFLEATKDQGDGVVTVESWSPVLPALLSDDLFGSPADYARDFEKRFGYAPLAVAPPASIAGLVLQKAIERSGSLDPAVVRDYIARFDENTFYGHVSFDQFGQLKKSAYVLQLQSPQVELVWPTEVAAKAVRYPLGWSQ